MFSNYDTILIYKGHIVVDYAKKNPLIGDVCIKDNKIYLYSSKNKWELMENTIPTNDTIYYTETNFKLHKLKPKICSCCGAPLRSNKCAYCDTEYR